MATKPIRQRGRGGRARGCCVPRHVARADGIHHGSDQDRQCGGTGVLEVRVVPTSARGAESGLRILDALVRSCSTVRLHVRLGRRSYGSATPPLLVFHGKCCMFCDALVGRRDTLVGWRDETPWSGGESIL